MIPRVLDFDSERRKRSKEDDGVDVPDDSSPEAQGEAPLAPAAADTAALVKIGTLLGPALDRAERRRSGAEVPVPIPFTEYADALGGGFWSGAHFMVSGTGVGKSQFTIQTALTAAKKGIATVYVGLELDEAQIALRVLGAHAGVGWSGLYVGRCSESAIHRAREAAPAIEGLPFYVDFGPPRGWPASRLYDLASNVRKKHPSGPMLVVLDYLQLVGDEPGAFERRPDLRERIGGAAYAARDVARRFDASIVIVSSAARTHYGLLASDAAEAGLTTTRTSAHSGPVKTIANPSALIGLGKESGELEFAGDSVTVLIKWPAPLENGETAIVAAVPKLRYGPGRWCALSFGAGTFRELPGIESVDDLPEVRKRGGGKAEVAAADLVDRIVATLTRIGPTKGRRQIVASTPGTTQKLYDAIKLGIASGKINHAEDGTLTAASVASEKNGGAKQ